MKRPYLCAALAVSALATLPAAVQAGTIKNGSPVDVTVGGQVDRAFLVVDDGTDTFYRNVDNESNSTRVFFNAEGTINSEWTAGSHFIWLMRSNPSNDVSASVESTAVTAEEDTMEVYFSSKRFGTLTLGQGYTASDATAEVDLSGTMLAGYSSISDIGGGFAFTRNGTRSSVTIGDVADNLDGLDKYDRVRYDTPEIAGFVFSTSGGPQGQVDAAVTYGTKIGATEVQAAFGWYNNSGADDEFTDGYTGSVSALLANGLNLTFAAGTKGAAAAGRDDPMFYYTKLGYTASLNSLGATHFAVDYGRYLDMSQNGDRFTTVGVQVVQDIESIGSNVFVGFRNYALSQTGVSYDDIRALFTGAYVAF